MVVESDLSRRKRAWATFVLALIAVAGLTAVWFLPPRIVDADVTVSGSAPNDWWAAVASVREAVLFATGGLIALVTLWLTWRRDDTSAQVAAADRAAQGAERDAKITNRYTDAINQLASDASSIQLGGIYALDRIAEDSERDRQTICDVLVAFVQEQRSAQDPFVTRVVMEVLARVSSKPGLSRGLRRANFGALDLSGLDLRGGNFDGVSFIGAQLGNVQLQNASLVDARLGKANLVGAALDRADLTDASLFQSSLAGSRFVEATLTRANFEQSVMCPEEGVYKLAPADFTGADLTGAKFEAAEISGVTFRQAVLDGVVQLHEAIGTADYRGADLRGAAVLLLGLSKHTCDETTQFPPGYTLPPGD